MALVGVPRWEGLARAWSKGVVDGEGIAGLDGGIGLRARLKATEVDIT